jgi:hypothetical protein
MGTGIEGVKFLNIAELPKSRTSNFYFKNSVNQLLICTTILFNQNNILKYYNGVGLCPGAAGSDR